MTGSRSRPIPRIELVSGFIGFLIVSFTIGYLGYEAWRPAALEAVIAVDVLRTRPSAGVFAVDIAIRNSGRAAAADVRVAGIPAGSADGIRPEARVDYIPGQSAAEATLIFPSDPGPKPDVRVLGYGTP